MGRGRLVRIVFCVMRETVGAILKYEVSANERMKRFLRPSRHRGPQTAARGRDL